MLLDFLSAKERAPAECLVKVNGQEISALYPFLLEITVQCGRAEAATASLTFETRRDELGRWTVQDAEVLTPWAPVATKAFRPATSGPPALACGATTISQRATSTGMKVCEENSCRSSISDLRGRSGVGSRYDMDRLALACGRRLPSASA